MKNSMSGRRGWLRVVQITLGCAALVAAGCGGEDAGSPVSSPPADLEPEMEVQKTEAEVTAAWTVAEVDGRYDPATGRLELTPVPQEASTGGMQPLAHGMIPDGTAANQVEFMTESYSAPQTTCGGYASSFCADVALRSHYSRRVNLTWVEFSNLPAGVTIRNADAVPAALAGYVVSPAIRYDVLFPNSKNTRTWVFGVPNANPFNFRATIKAAPPRTAYTLTTGAGSFSNACTQPGATVLIGANDSSSTVPVNLPFPVSVYDMADIVGNVSVRGVFYLGNDNFIGTTSAQLPTYYLPRGGIAAFWEGLRTRPLAPLGRVCRASVGVRPNRTFTVTWENMRFAGGDNNPVMTISLRLLETSDIIQVFYRNMGNPVEPIDRTRGSLATVGFQGYTSHLGPCNDANVCRTLFYRTPFLPATSVQYPVFYTFRP